MQTETKEISLVPEFPANKFPRLASLKEQAKTYESLIECLKKRKEFALSKIKFMDHHTEVHEDRGFLYNEQQIVVYTTQIELANKYSSLYKLQSNIKDYETKFIAPYMKDMLCNFYKVKSQALELSETDKVMKQVCDSSDWEMFEENWEYKLDFYIRAKNYMSLDVSTTGTQATT
jgi:hypothetical protein